MRPRLFRLRHRMRYAVAFGAARACNALASPAVDLVLWLQGKAQESRRILDGDAPAPRRMRTGMNPAPRSGAVQHAIIANLAFWAAVGEISLSAIVWRSSALAALCLLALAAVLVWIGWRAARDANQEIEG